MTNTFETITTAELEATTGGFDRATARATASEWGRAGKLSGAVAGGGAFGAIGVGAAVVSGGPGVVATPFLAAGGAALGAVVGNTVGYGLGYAYGALKTSGQ